MVARPIGEVHQHYNLPFRVATADVPHIADIPRVHTYQQVIAVVVRARHLPSRLAHTADAVLSQFPSGRGIDAVANLLRRGGCRLNYEAVLQHPLDLRSSLLTLGRIQASLVLLSFNRSLPHQVLHHELCHRASADVPVTHEKYSMFCLAIHYHSRFVFRRQIYTEFRKQSALFLKK